MTQAQRIALAVLAESAPQRVEAHKRMSALQPVPRVNAVAALNLARAGLAKLHVRPNASPYSSAYEYTITAAGQQQADLFV